MRVRDRAFQSFALSAAAGLLMAACAAPAEESAAPSPDRDCFNLSAVSGYSAPGGDRVHLSVGAGRTYEADLLGPGCRNLRWSEQVALETRPSSWICVGEGAGLGEIRFRDSVLDQVTRCQITAVRRMPEPAPAPAP